MYEDERTELAGTFKTDAIKFTDDKGNLIEFFPSDIKLYMRETDYDPYHYGRGWSKDTIPTAMERVWLEVELPTHDIYARYTVPRDKIERSVTFETATWNYDLSEYWKKKLNVPQNIEIFEYTKIEDKLVIVNWSWEESV